MITTIPIAKLLLYAYADERLSYEQMVRWADEFGLRRGELIEIYEALDDAGTTCCTAFAPSPRGGRPRTQRVDVAQAYAEGWIGLDRVLFWAEEQEFEDDETMALLDLCAAEGHGH